MNLNDSQQITNFYQTENSKLFCYALKSGYMGRHLTKGRIRFCTLIRGEVVIDINDESFTLKQSEFLILPSYSDIYIEANNYTSALVYEISDTLIKEVYDSSNIFIDFSPVIDQPVAYYKQKYSGTLLEDISHIHHAFLNKKEDAYLLDLLIKKLVYHLLKTNAGMHIFSIKTKNRMEQAAFMIKRKALNDINLSEIAKKFDMSTSNFSHTFKTYFDISPKSYLNNYKLELSKDMLNDHSVTEVAYLIGYENISNFIKQFKKKYHQTPKQYQLSHKQLL